MTERRRPSRASAVAAVAMALLLGLGLGECGAATRSSFLPGRRR
jgi:hypothetical protein